MQNDRWLNHLYAKLRTNMRSKSARRVLNYSLHAPRFSPLTPPSPCHR